MLVRQCFGPAAGTRARAGAHPLVYIYVVYIYVTPRHCVCCDLVGFAGGVVLVVWWGVCLGGVVLVFVSIVGE